MQIIVFLSNNCIIPDSSNNDIQLNHDNGGILHDK